jgi:adenylate kinase
MNIIILGPPGSGKGTCANIISKIFELPVITTGDMLREFIKSQTKYGKIAKCYIKRGELVPDRIVNCIVKKRLCEGDTKNGFILDGYPRSISQAEALDKILAEKDSKIDYVIYLDLEDKLVIDRLTLRRVCPKCGSIFHIKNNPSKVKNICDKCGAVLIQRNDDEEEIIRKRLKVYHSTTKKLFKRYYNKGILKKIRGDIPLKDLPDFLRELFV